MGDVVHILDDSYYRRFKIAPPSVPVILKRTNHSTYRSFLLAVSQLLISSPRMVNQSTQIDSQPTDTEEPLAVTFFNVVALPLWKPVIEADLFVLAISFLLSFLNPSLMSQFGLGETNYKNEIVMTIELFTNRNNINKMINMNTSNSNVFQLLFFSNFGAYLYYS